MIFAGRIVINSVYPFLSKLKMEQDELGAGVGGLVQFHQKQ